MPSSYSPVARNQGRDRMKRGTTRWTRWITAAVVVVAMAMLAVGDTAAQPAQCHMDYWDVTGTVTLKGGPGYQGLGDSAAICVPGPGGGWAMSGGPGGVFTLNMVGYYGGTSGDGNYMFCNVYPGYLPSLPQGNMTCGDEPDDVCLISPPPAGCSPPPPPMGQCEACRGSFQIDLYPGDERPEIRGPYAPPPRVSPTPPQPSCPAPNPNVGEPVNVMNGNVWLDQIDAVVPGAVGLAFGRSYNSGTVLITTSNPGALGRGWSFSYGRTLNFLSPTLIKLRQDDGQVLYFEDQNADLLFPATYPKWEESSILKTGSTYVRSFVAGGSEAYDAQGRLVSITDAIGNTRTLTRDTNGRLLSINAPSGRSLTFAYNASGRISSLSGPDGPIATYRYTPDVWAMLARVTYRDGTGYSFAYDGSGRLLSVTDLAGVVVEQHTYDAAGRGLTSSLADGREKYTLAYNGVTTVVTDALGNATTYEWTGIKGAYARLTRVVGPCSSCGGGGEVQEFTYDGDGRLETTTDAIDRVTKYSYDGGSTRIATITELFGTPEARTTTYTYDTHARVLSVARPGGTLTAYTQSPSGPLTITQKVTATENREWTIVYNAQGRPQTVTDPRGKITTFAYHMATTDLASVTDPLGHAISFGYDANGRRTTVTDALNHATTTAYDLQGRVARLTRHDGTYTTIEYDKSGRRSKVIDPLGRPKSFTYDAYGRLASTIDATGGVTRYSYDLMGRLTSVIDAKDQATAFEYNVDGQVKKLIYPDGAFETLTYDAVGRLQTSVDRKAVTTTFGYDSFDRLTSKTYSNGGPAVTYGYDAADRLVTAANAIDSLTWTYDFASQILTEQSTKNSSTVAYTYDLAGNRLTLSLDGSLFVSYAYDDASRLTTMTRGGNVFTLDYDNVNRRTTLAYPNGVNTAYTYDNLDRVLGIIANKGSNTIASSTYTYDAADNRLTKTHPEYSETYKYDQLNRLTDVDRAGLAKRQRYVYDTVGNRLSEQVDDNVTAYTYNNLNQLLSTTGGGTLRWRGALNEAGNVTFTSATVNGKPARMLAGNAFEADVPVTPGTNAVTLVARDRTGNTTTKNYSVNVIGTGATYTYDLNGNLATKAEGLTTWTYEWDAEDQLKRVLNSGSEVARFAYDPLGRRVEMVAGTVTTTWTHDGDDVLRESGASVNMYVHGPGIDEPLASEHSAGASIANHADGLGSVIKSTNDLGATVGGRQYDVWGSIEVGAATGYAFTGREWTAEIGLAYHRARYYDPATGRFTSQDPLMFRGGINFYAYVEANPPNATDPFGRSSAFWFGFRAGQELASRPTPTPTATPAPPPMRTPVPRPLPGPPGGEARYAPYPWWKDVGCTQLDCENACMDETDLRYSEIGNRLTGGALELCAAQQASKVVKKVCNRLEMIKAGIDIGTPIGCVLTCDADPCRFSHPTFDF